VSNLLLPVFYRGLDKSRGLNQLRNLGDTVSLEPSNEAASRS
jgi:hypothetical protein